jgi:hypothetical protein
LTSFFSNERARRNQKGSHNRDFQFTTSEVFRYEREHEEFKNRQKNKNVCSLGVFEPPIGKI